MKKRTAGCLTTLLLATGLLASGCEGKVCERKVYTYNYAEIGSLEIHKKIHSGYSSGRDTYKVIFKAPDNKLTLEIIIPKHPDSSFTMTDQHGDTYILDQKRDYGLTLDKERDYGLTPK